MAASFGMVVLALAAIDLEHRIIPNRIVIPATAAILVAQIAVSPDRALEWAAAALGAAAFLLLPLLVYPSGMGMGDVKLALLLGAGLGWSVVPAFVVGLLAAFVAALVVLARGGLSARKTALPFAPFLACGALVALFLVTLPLVEAGISLAVQFQISRVFWLVDLLAIVYVPIIFAYAGYSSLFETVVRVARWPLLALVVLLVLALLYRYGPCRQSAKWRWVSVGAMFATVVWLAASIGFSFYVANFANYDRIYGSLGAVIVLLFWLYLSFYIVLLGAHLDSAASGPGSCATPTVDGATGGCNVGFETLPESSSETVGWRLEGELSDAEVEAAVDFDDLAGQEAGEMIDEAGQEKEPGAKQRMGKAMPHH